MDQRMVAALFTDLADSTVTFRRLGQVEADRVRAAHFSDLALAVAEFGGEVVKTMGDGVMAIFPLASAALDGAAAAQRRFCDPGAADLLSGLRVGVSVGQVTVIDGDCNGAAITEAARLCGAAKPGQVLCSRIVRQMIRDSLQYSFQPVEPLSLRGISDAFEADELVWERPAAMPMRVVLADDAVILRQGIARLLQDEGFRVVGQAADATELLRLVVELVPDVVVTDIRMPPKMSLDGLEAALEIRRRFPQIGILVLSQHIETEYALQLLGEDATGVGYLLKERIAAVDEFAAAVRRVAHGGTAVDTEIVDALMTAPTHRAPLATLSERERAVLSLMAEGMSNAGIAERLVVSQRTVESHVAAIFTKLGIAPERQDDRRVLAVVQYLQAAG